MGNGLRVVEVETGARSLLLRLGLPWRLPILARRIGLRVPPARIPWGRSNGLIRVGGFLSFEPHGSSWREEEVQLEALHGNTGDWIALAEEAVPVHGGRRLAIADQPDDWFQGTPCKTEQIAVVTCPRHPMLQARGS